MCSEESAREEVDVLEMRMLIEMDACRHGVKTLYRIGIRNETNSVKIMSRKICESGADIGIICPIQIMI